MIVLSYFNLLTIIDKVKTTGSEIKKNDEDSYMVLLKNKDDIEKEDIDISVETSSAKEDVSSTPESHSSNNASQQSSGHYEERQICVQNAYDEQVLVKKDECKQILVQDAYDTKEMVYLEGAFYGPDTELKNYCYICNHLYDECCEQQGHPSSTTQAETSEPYWHNVEYRTVHHDAVYETQKVWVED